MPNEANEYPQKKQQQQQQQSLAYRQRKCKNNIRTFEILRCVRWQIALRCCRPTQASRQLAVADLDLQVSGEGGLRKIFFRSLGLSVG